LQNQFQLEGIDGGLGIFGFDLFNGFLVGTGVLVDG